MALAGFARSPIRSAPTPAFARPVRSRGVGGASSTRSSETTFIRAAADAATRGCVGPGALDRFGPRPLLAGPTTAPAAARAKSTSYWSRCRAVLVRHAPARSRARTGGAQLSYAALLIRRRPLRGRASRLQSFDHFAAEIAALCPPSCGVQPRHSLAAVVAALSCVPRRPCGLYDWARLMVAECCALPDAFEAVGLGSSPGQPFCTPRITPDVRPLALAATLPGLDAVRRKTISAGFRSWGSRCGARVTS